MTSRPFDPFGLWAGPWFFMDLGLTLMRSWQEACYSRLRLDVAMQPFALSLPRVAFAKADAERTRLEGEIAARQGRDLPLLGCLSGVRVVGDPDTAVEEKPVEKWPGEKGAVAKKPGARAAEITVAGTMAKAPSKPKAAAETLAMETADAEVAAVPVASSVTSMLAMQARSLSKAVAKAPKTVAKAPKTEPVKPAVTKNAAAKPAVKATVKPALKPAAKPFAKQGSSKKA